MIVICTKCQAKFRVADDKIGPRGAKVRCSKCQTVFLVHPVLGTMPVTDGDGGHVAPKAGPEGDAARAVPPPVPPPAPARAAPAPSPDPFGGADPFAVPPADPFAPPAAAAAD